MKKTITNFIISLQENHFIEAHEILEVSWKDLKRQGRLEEARIQKGLINGATAIGLHLQKGRPEAAQRLWDAYVVKYQSMIKVSDVPHASLYQRAAVMLDSMWSEFCEISKPEKRRDPLPAS